MKSPRASGIPIVSWILWLTAAHLVIALLDFAIWRITGNYAWIDFFFKYQGSLFLLGCAAVEAGLAWRVFRQFSPGEPMRNAWLFIFIASFYRFTGYLFTQVLSIDSYINPIYLYRGFLDEAVASAFQQFGHLVSGPLHMAVLAAGLFLILRVLRRLHILSRLRVIDYLLLAAVAAFAVREFHELYVWLQKTSEPDNFLKLLSWAVDPFLGILLLEAILIHRSAADTGWGLLALSWRAFAAGILLTLLGNIGIWLTREYYLPWPYNSVTWYIWFLASAAYALGPAYQVEAYRRTLRNGAVN